MPVTPSTNLLHTLGQFAGHNATVGRATKPATAAIGGVKVVSSARPAVAAEPRQVPLAGGGKGPAPRGSIINILV